MGNIQSAATCVVSARRSEATKALLRCAEAGDVAELGALLDSDARGVLLSSVFGGNTAWHKAAKAGRVDVLEALKAAVLQQYARDSKDVAAEAVAARPSVLRLGGSAVDAVARLINKGNMKGCTPLMLACSGAHTDAVAWLIQHGARAVVWCRDVSVGAQQVVSGHAGGRVCTHSRSPAASCCCSTVTLQQHGARN